MKQHPDHEARGHDFHSENCFGDERTYKYKKMISKSISGMGRDHKPRLVGSIINEILHSDSPLALGYRKYLTSKEKGGQA